MGVCTEACKHSEEECAACLNNQYAGGCKAQEDAVRTAEAAGRIDARVAAALVAQIEAGEQLFRALLAEKKGV